MIERYEDPEIKKIWAHEHKLALWQESELAVIKAMANLKMIGEEIYTEISQALTANPIDIDWWLKREKEVRHDLNAFLDERRRFLAPKLQIYFHKNTTSYDTEEPAFAKMLQESLNLVMIYHERMLSLLTVQALKYRYTVMNARTHGQEAELQSFGKRCLSWFADFKTDGENLDKAAENLKLSKLSGAIGNYGSIDPLLEEETLRILGLAPYYGATQIMPRELYAPLAEALCQMVQTINKIALAIRLGARSGRPIYQEPFGKKQKGSSAMPHKKNTTNTEQIAGMADIASGYLSMIMGNITTWEERAIEQSCVERVAWPDLFHVAIHSQKTLQRVIEGLVVYPDNMLKEIVENRGCYASSEAKEILKELGLPFGLTSEEAYRVIQLAAFNVFEPRGEVKRFRDELSTSLIKSDQLLSEFKKLSHPKPISIQELITKAKLRVSPELDSNEDEVYRWNGILGKIFKNKDNLQRWNQIFQPSYLLRNEEKLYQEILGM